jgi:hypothetical protein
MKKISLSLLLILFSLLNLHSQTISEKELFILTYKGDADVYSFIYDSLSGNYCYLYNVKDENKSFIISNNSRSDKYDYVLTDDIKFDDKGNYYAITTDYKADYGIDNYFLVVNGKEILNYNYIESYGSYINKNGEFEFIFKEFDLYKFGYYSIENGFRQSQGYELIHTILSFNEARNQWEGDAEGYSKEDFYLNEKGERGFIAIDSGKAKIIFGTDEILTPYSDIDESSITMNKNNELSFIAKRDGKFYEKNGNEFAVSGKKEYNEFEIERTPLLFNIQNEPAYIAGDSLSEYLYNYYAVVGNEIQPAFLDENKTKKAPEFNYDFSYFKIDSSGELNYIGAKEIVIPGINENPGDTAYDEYYSLSYFVKDKTAYELGYNIGQMKTGGHDDLLYSAIADLEKKERLLLLNYGQSRVILNKKKFDDIYDYGFTPAGEIYYTGQNYEDQEQNKKAETYLYIGNKQIGKYEYILFQSSGEEGSILKFDSKNNYAFVAEEKVDSLTVKDFVVTNSGLLSFPSGNISGSKMFYFISNLMYSKNDILFFIGDMIYDPLTYKTTKEIFVNNKSLGKIYNSINKFNYDEANNLITFLASRENKIYLVTVKF